VPRNKEPSKPQGRFVPCSASFVAHEGWVFCEVYLSAAGKWFAYCGGCRSRVFLNTWEAGWGFTLQQAEAPQAQGGWGAKVDIPPPRRQALEAASRSRRKSKKNRPAAAKSNGV
jgi:hypothetical protein